MKPHHQIGLAGGCLVFCVGSIMCFFGFLLCLTGIGALLGVPLIIAGMGIAYGVAPVFGVAIGCMNQAAGKANSPRPSTRPDPQVEPNTLPHHHVLPPLPPRDPQSHDGSYAADGLKAPFRKGGDLVLRFFGTRETTGADGVVRVVPWHERFSLLALSLIFIWPLGILLTWLSSRLDRHRKVVITIAGVVWGALSMMAPDAPSSRGVVTPWFERIDQRAIQIGREALGEAWPFTVPQGILRCEGTGSVRSVTFTANSRVYAINGTASSFADRRDWLPLKMIWRDDTSHPGVDGIKVSISPLIDLGLALGEPTEELRQKAIDQWKVLHIAIPAPAK